MISIRSFQEKALEESYFFSSDVNKKSISFISRAANEQTGKFDYVDLPGMSDLRSLCCTRQSRDLTDLSHRRARSGKTNKKARKLKVNARCEKFSKSFHPSIQAVKGVHSSLFIQCVLFADVTLKTCLSNFSEAKRQRFCPFTVFFV